MGTVQAGSEQSPYPLPLDASQDGRQPVGLVSSDPIPRHGIDELTEGRIALVGVTGTALDSSNAKIGDTEGTGKADKKHHYWHWMKRKVGGGKGREAEEVAEVNAPKFKDVTNLNELLEKAGRSTGEMFKHVEMLKTGQVPVQLIVDTLVTAVKDFNDLKGEMEDFRREGLNSMDDINDRFEEIMASCRQVSTMAANNEKVEAIVERLEGIMDSCQAFFELINARCKQLQSLRVKAARTWLATTSVAGFTVGGAAAALTLLSGGAALPVLAPIFAFGAGTTAVATASHVAFSPSLGAQIKSMDDQITQLEELKMRSKIIIRKADTRKQMTEAAVSTPHKASHKWSLW